MSLISIPPMPRYDYLILVIGWLGWGSAFIVRNRSRTHVERRARGARWGIILQGIAYSILWQNQFWTRRPTGACMVISIFLFAVSITVAWAGRHALGRQWRVDAALGADHQLVRSGIYSILRHPIYFSMVCLLLATGLMITPWIVLFCSFLLFAIGTRIRVSFEEELLQSRFGTDFTAYRREVAGFVPFARGL